MPLPESTERPKQAVDLPRETARSVAETERLLSSMEECELQPQKNKSELDGRKWDLKNVVGIGDFYFISGLNQNPAQSGAPATYPMQVLRIKDGRISQAEDVPPAIVGAAAKKIMQMRGLAPAQSAAAPITPPTEAPPHREQPMPAAAPERARQNEGSDIQSVFDALQFGPVTVGDSSAEVRLSENLSTPVKLASYLRKNGIPVARYATYTQTMREQHASLSKVLAKSSGNWTVRFIGSSFEATAGKYEIKTTATDVLIKGGEYRSETSLISGTTVGITPKAVGVEYNYGDETKEYHRTDSLQYRKKPDGTIQFFDGSNTQPTMEKKGDNITVFGPDGSGVDVLRRPKEADADRYINELAAKLKTPEAIGAYLSQFYLTHEYTGSPEQLRSYEVLKKGNGPVNYQADPQGEQDVQRWDETLVKGKGDCEDYALLGQELLERAGIRSFAMLVDPNHYQAVFFENAGVDENGRQQYHACSVGLSGFQRSKETFTDLGEAAKSQWNGGSGVASGVDTILNTNEKEANKVQDGGIVVQKMPNSRSDRSGTLGVVPYKKQSYYAYYIRR